MRYGLTPRQARVKVYIAQRIKRDGIAPSIAEIARDCNLSSEKSARAVIGELVSRGHLLRRAGQHRALAVVEGRPLREAVVEMLFQRIRMGGSSPAVLESTGCDPAPSEAEAVMAFKRAVGIE